MLFDIRTPCIQRGTDELCLILTFGGAVIYLKVLEYNLSIEQCQFKTKIQGLFCILATNLNYFPIAT